MTTILGLLLGGTALALPLQEAEGAQLEPSCQELIDAVQSASEDGLQIPMTLTQARRVAYRGEAQPCERALARVEQQLAAAEPAQPLAPTPPPERLVAPAQGEDRPTRPEPDPAARIDRTEVDRPEADRTETDQIETEAQTEVQRETRTAADVDTVRVVTPQPRVSVEQSPPNVSVRQAQPNVSVRQAEPEIVVRMQQPTVRVQMPRPTITIEQPQPEVIVRLPEPQVGVTQAQPQVEVRQAPPTVSVQQPEPSVRVSEGSVPEEGAGVAGETGVSVRQQALIDVQQAEPEVQIEQAEGEPQVDYASADPQVRIEGGDQPDVQIEGGEAPNVEFRRTGEVQVRVLRGDEPVPPARAQASQNAEAPQQAMQTAPRGATTELRTENVRGAGLINEEEDELGEVADVVERDGQTFALVKAGGFLGLGERSVLVPLGDLSLRGNRLVAAGYTQDRLEAMPEAEADSYRRSEAETVTVASQGG
ncbi:PRC-barrel domain-containing protein [Parvularcula dongshanensis]|uniref:PRC-barrel domain-containing protein n=1 Tax=Parvularcula dongshanensis TaxID=1173995 RepID=A0A840I330_9PROT|nr:PRC-barrel domain-containing protein [Parvularcula dongshanensis]MBB4658450.1 hypothetical protein [Parvularcula dongshanensis]